MDFAKLNVKRSQLDFTKLEWLNKQHVERKSNTPEGRAALIKQLKPFVADEDMRQDEAFMDRLFTVLRVRFF